MKFAGDPGAIWAYAGAIVLLIISHQIQQGGLRRRRRREIREEIEFLGVLGRRLPDVSDRICRRLEVALNQYEPSPESRVARLEWWLPKISMAIAVASLIPVVLWLDLTIEQPLRIVAAAAASATLGILIEAFARRRSSKSQLDALCGRRPAKSAVIPCASNG